MNRPTIFPKFTGSLILLAKPGKESGQGLGAAERIRAWCLAMAGICKRAAALGRTKR